MAHAGLRALAAPSGACLLSLAALRLGLAPGSSMQNAYLQLGLLAANRPIPVDPSIIALLAPMICMLYSIQPLFVVFTCEKTALFYRQSNLIRLSIEALCGTATCVLSFVLVVVVASVFSDLLFDASVLPLSEMVATITVRFLVLFVTAAFENALYLLVPVIAGFLVTGCLFVGITLNLERLAPATIASLFPAFHLYALSGGVIGRSLVMSCGYLGACSVGLGLWLVWLLRRHDV